MSTINITVTLDANGTGLILNDGQSNGPNITTQVSVGDIVRWKLIPNSGIESIDGVQDQSTIDLFNPDPSQQPDDSWQGTVGNFASGLEESYNILYTVGGRSHQHDPKIQLH